MRNEYKLCENCQASHLEGGGSLCLPCQIIEFKSKVGILEAEAIAYNHKQQLHYDNTIDRLNKAEDKLNNIKDIINNPDYDSDETIARISEIVNGG